MAGDNKKHGNATGGDNAAEWLPPKMRDIDISIPYSNPPTDQLMDFYASWAEHYDTDLIDAYGYMAPTDAVAGMMTLGLPSDAHILDAGCGTGQAGALLAAAGFTHIDGADLSPEMRDVAARLGVYKNLYHLDMTTDYAPQIAEVGGGNDGTYDAVICVGVFGYGPPHVEDLPRIMDAVRPGAPVLVTVNGKGWEKMGWERQPDACSGWRRRNPRRPHPHPPYGERRRACRIAKFAARFDGRTRSHADSKLTLRLHPFLRRHCQVGNIRHALGYPKVNWARVNNFYWDPSRDCGPQSNRSNID